MQTLPVENKPIVSNTELNITLEFGRKYQNDEIKIDFNNPILKIDIVFIAGIILLAQQNSLKYRISYPGPIFKRIFELRHYLKQFHELYGREWTHYFTYIKGIENLYYNDFVASESFAPIIQIDQKIIESFFVKSNRNEISTAIGLLADLYISEKLINKKSNNKETEYFDRPDSICQILGSYPPIYAFVFTILYNKIDPFVRTSEKGIKDPIERIYELWEFSIEYTKGLHELAKNIVEHSTTKVGMITLRVYDNQELTEDSNVAKVLETYVFDYGEIGLVPNLIEFTQNNKDKNKLFEEDLKILADSQYNLCDFMKPNREKLLHQQFQREIAHYGLVKFNQLIERNEGNMVCSSKSKDNEREFFKNNNNIQNKCIDFGTSFFFQLPFKPDLFKVNKTIHLSSEMQGIYQTVDSLARILNFTVVNDSTYENSLNNDTTEVILDYNFDIIIKNRIDEELIFSQIKNFVIDKKVAYLSINLLDAELSFSSLLRLTALVSNNLSQSIIIYNVDVELYSSMIKDYMDFFSILNSFGKNITFWNVDKGVLFFSMNKNPLFNFSDILYGKSADEFRIINQIINFTFPNLFSLGKVSLEADYQPPRCLTPFFYQTSLLPFDVLLENENKKTIFQSNLEFILSQELKMSNTSITQGNEQFA